MRAEKLLKYFYYNIVLIFYICFFNDVKSFNTMYKINLAALFG